MKFNSTPKDGLFFIDENHLPKFMKFKQALQENNSEIISNVISEILNDYAPDEIEKSYDLLNTKESKINKESIYEIKENKLNYYKELESIRRKWISKNLLTVQAGINLSNEEKRDLKDIYFQKTMSKDSGSWFFSKTIYFYCSHSYMNAMNTNFVCSRYKPFDLEFEKENLFHFCTKAPKELIKHIIKYRNQKENRIKDTCTKKADSLIDRFLQESIKDKNELVFLKG